MPREMCGPQEFAALMLEHGSPAAVAKILGMSERNVYARRARLEGHGWHLPTTSPNARNGGEFHAYPQRQSLMIDNGTAVVFSDRHWWPGDGITPAEAALLALLLQLDPDVVIANGDILDGARQSKHPPLGWEVKPKAADELATVQVGMRRIADHCKRAIKLRTVGNHDRRFDYHLSKTAPDYRGIVGMRLADHLPDWPESWSIHVNATVKGGHCVVKHKMRQGIGAARNNVQHAGTHIVTGHTHALDWAPFETYGGRAYGIQCGTLADARSAAFEYSEDHPAPGRAGFVVLTWRDGIMQPPELVEVDDAGVAWFRGEPVAIKPRVRVRAG